MSGVGVARRWWALQSWVARVGGWKEAMGTPQERDLGNRADGNGAVPACSDQIAACCALGLVVAVE